MWEPEADAGQLLYYAVPYLGGQGLSRNLELTESARQVGQRAPGTLLALSPRCWSYGHMLVPPKFLRALRVHAQVFVRAQEELY